MATENQKKATLLIGGGVFGFLIGYLSHPLRRKAAPSGVIFEDLEITPETVYPGDTVTIRCRATNHNGEANTFTVFATVGNNILQQEVFLEPEIPTEVVFHYNLPAQVTNYYVTVSVGDLVGVFLVSEGEVF